ncbi:MAG: glycosyltransferase family 4 protein [Fimbriimonadaceae bacterium]|nr:glycosyltransferase family 4 protein [Fimbriimonadaceae bacterium]
MKGRLCLVGHGSIPIPPPGWGAVETVIHEQATILRARGWEVDIVNVNRKLAPGAVVRLALGGRRPDWVWCHNEKAVPGLALACSALSLRMIATSHTPASDWAARDFPAHRPLCRASRAAFHLALTKPVATTMKILNRKCLAEVHPNGVAVDLFRYSPTGNGRAVCVGQIHHRKRQPELHRLAQREDLPIDFVGPHAQDLPPRDRIEGSDLWLGEWSRGEMHDRLTEWSCLVLWSASEAHPLVVLEAMAAGLSVVVSPEASANLDRSLPWIHIAKTEEDVATAVREAVHANPAYRSQIRACAKERWSWEKAVDRLESILDKWAGGRAPNPLSLNLDDH